MPNIFVKYSMAVFLLITNHQVTYCQDYAKYVNPFIGTAGTGHTYPGATTPFGMVQLNPNNNNYGWQYCSGYQFADSTIIGFAHSQLNGTGWMDMGDILMLAYMAEKSINPVISAMNKTTEKASAGYYAVELDNNLKAELTTTERTSLQRYTFKKSGAAHVLLDLQSGIVNHKEDLLTHVLASEITIENSTIISGFARSKFWVEKQIYFVVKFDKPFTNAHYLDSSLKRKLVVDLNVNNGEALIIRVALSTVSVDGAKKNLAAESASKSFETIHAEAIQKWNKFLSTVQVEGTDSQKENFYTAMYHAAIQPNNVADVDGKYTGADNKVHISANQKYYSTISLWDTYRGAHPLYTLIVPEVNSAIIQSMVQHFKTTGLLPGYAMWGKDGGSEGCNGVPVVANAILKNMTGFNKQKAWEAIKATLTKPRINSVYDWGIYRRYGYLPCDSVKTESVSRTLEISTDDWAAAMAAKKLGYPGDYEYFFRRSQFYRNLFDPATKLMRGRKTNGNWNTPFDPLKIAHAQTSGGDYTEGNAWQYTWLVQHDVNGLMKLMGGPSAFGKKLDSLFYAFPSSVYGDGFTGDVTGLIGQYAHGNEPCHHIAYLYDYCNQPYKTQELIPQILKEQYQNKPDGLSGNDDCGQMSAWYVLSSIGFYPVNPASVFYEIGVPSFKEVKMKVGRKTLLIRANELSDKKRYIKSVKLNGKAFYSFRLSYKEIMQGGFLEFDMTDKPVSFIKSH